MWNATLPLAFAELRNEDPLPQSVDGGTTLDMDAAYNALRPQPSA